MTPSPIIPRLDMTVRQVHEIAKANGMYVIRRGDKILISPTIPPGWQKDGAGIKHPTRKP